MLEVGPLGTDCGALGVGIGWLASPDSIGVPGRFDDGWLSYEIEFCFFIEPGAFTPETAWKSGGTKSIKFNINTVFSSEY